VNDKFGRMCKETLMTHIKVLSLHLWGGIEENIKICIRADLQTEIQTENFRLHEAEFMRR
jgi:hypothetical protein